MGYLQGTLEAPALPLAEAPTSGWPNSQGPKQNISEMGFSEPPWPNSTPQGSEHPISDQNPYFDSAGVCLNFQSESILCLYRYKCFTIERTILIYCLGKAIIIKVVL